MTDISLSPYKAAIFRVGRFVVMGIVLATAIAWANAATPSVQQPAALPNPIMFVTQFPIPADFATIGSVFSNHGGRIDWVGRGGDLYIRYPDGSLRNLTAGAGYGNSGMQGANSIAVRDPAVDWSGTKAVFSMVIGAPTQQYVWSEWYWQLYEITGFGQGQTASIVKVQNQPTNYNNVQPTYASDGSIIFVSDRPRNGQRYLYPQHDEYESTASPSGLWNLKPATGALTLLQHSPSGSFTPFVDSFGRVIFTRWDHLQRDQQADSGGYGNFNWASEAPDAAMLATTAEAFPEPRSDTAQTFGLLFNQFFPWTVNQDGSGEETLNHIGRHELANYFNCSIRCYNYNGITALDTNLHEFIAPSGRNDSEMWLQIREDPQVPGRYLAINAPEFYTHASGQIIAITAPPTTNASAASVSFLTPRSTRTYYNSGAPPVDFTGHYRNPLPLSDGQLISGYTSEPRSAGNDGTREFPQARYQFRLQRLSQSTGYFQPAEALTGAAGISKPVPTTYWDPDVLVTYNGPLWELSPVEVRVRPVPPVTAAAIAAPEAQAFTLEGVSSTDFRDFLKRYGLAVLVVRNATTRDAADRQQPYNLRVPGGVQTVPVGNSGTIYDIPFAQFLQGDQIRGIGGMVNPTPGRRVLAEPLHDADALRFMPPAPGAPSGGVALASDGSLAVIVPAQRAMTWQTTAADGTPVVRERYWISAQPGEIRACDGCHGVNQLNQAQQVPAQNTPIALRNLIAFWRVSIDPLFKNGFN
ncbi:MAG: hypothetical protein ABI451_03875 [Dokdonella sp.]